MGNGGMRCALLGQWLRLGVRWAGNESGRALASSVFFVLGPWTAVWTAELYAPIHGFPFLQKKLLRSNLTRFTIAIRRPWSNSTGLLAIRTQWCTPACSRPHPLPPAAGDVCLFCFVLFFRVQMLSLCVPGVRGCIKKKSFAYCLLPFASAACVEAGRDGARLLSTIAPGESSTRASGRFLKFPLLCCFFFSPLARAPAVLLLFSSSSLYTDMHACEPNKHTDTDALLSLFLALMTAGLLRVPLIYVPVHHGQPLTGVRLSGGRKGAKERNRDTGEKRKREIWGGTVLSVLPGTGCRPPISSSSPAPASPRVDRSLCRWCG